jgi:septum site-determining protein MinD
MKKVSRKIGVISGKGGVGKTTTSINLGASINYFGKTATVLDANLTTPNVGVYIGVPVLPVTLHDVLRGKKEVHDALFLHKSGTRFITASIALKDLKRVDPKKLVRAVKDLDGSADYLLIDCAAGLGREAIHAVKSVDEIIMVTNPEMAAVTDALKTVRLCKEFGKTIVGVVVTKTNAKNQDMPLKDIEEMLEVPIIGVIPEDRAVKESHVQKDAVVHTHPKSAASINYKKLAASLLGIEHYEEQLERAPMTVWDWFGKFLGLK